MGLKIRREDMVVVIAGRDRGKKGKVQRVFPRDGMVMVEGVNMVTRHQRARPNLRQAGRVQQEVAIGVSKVMLVCKHCDKGTRVGFRLLEGGKRVRYCKECQETID
ncbi:MAG: 50S ribosomal protein L24 [Chloroflexi bacterium]|nr:50S ribosomal protein L24 [Chloroflexota bacterium]